jgi:hypothetical protein
MTLAVANDDLMHFDGLEAVVLTRPGSAMRHTLEKALMRPIASVRAVPAEAYHTVFHARWYLSQQELTETPRPGDVLTDCRDDAWVISAVRNSPRNRCWRCESRHIVLHHGLDEFVDLFRAEYVASDAGVPQPRWRPWRTGLPAKRSAPVLRDSDADAFPADRVSVEFFLAENEPVLPTDRLRMHDGLWFRLLKIHQSQRDHWLTRVEAEILSAT